MKAKLFLIAPVMVSLGACVGGKNDKTMDRFLDSGHLSTLVAGIWVDPNGCDHWIIDDGVEGYMSERLSPYGKPVCSGAAPPGYATGPFKGGRAGVSKFDPI